MSDPNSAADRIHRELEAAMLLPKLTPEQEAEARAEYNRRIDEVLAHITPQAIEAAVRAQLEAADEPFGVLHYRLAPGCYNTVLISREEFARIQNRRHDAQQRLDEIERLAREFPDPLGASLLTAYLARRRSELL